MRPSPRSGSVPPLVLFIMTAVTGVLDAVSSLAAAHVFTANMTGNIVFLGFATAGASDVSIPRSESLFWGFLPGGAAG
jgi:uncharacterized membrane protein YoaK (UPF0700 family)